MNVIKKQATFFSYLETFSKHPLHERPPNTIGVLPKKKISTPHYAARSSFRWGNTTLATFRLVQACFISYRQFRISSVVFLSHSRHLPGNIPI